VIDGLKPFRRRTGRVTVNRTPHNSAPDSSAPESSAEETTQMDAKDSNDKNDTFAQPMDRRRLVKDIGFAAAAGALTAGFPATPAGATIGLPIDADILNFALNLEYLEAEYYLRATTGAGLPSGDTTGVGTKGTVVEGSIVTFENPNVRQFAQEIARDEKAHVEFLRSALGPLAVAEPQIDLQTSFTTAARKAGIIGQNDTFNPLPKSEQFFARSVHLRRRRRHRLSRRRAATQ